jgi:uncharacterized damage-inducible protein DinB
MSNTIFATEFIRELEAEATSTRKCLERFPEKLFGWKPHEKSMDMGYLALLVAEIPKWITHVIEKGEIDLATFPHSQAKTGADLAKHFDENMRAAKDALQNNSDDALSGKFSLKNQDQILLTSSKKETVSQSINHMVHHRGQLTIYLRLNDIPVPSIYGPSADDRTF